MVRGGGHGTCEDKLSEDKCKAILDAGKCDKKPGKQCKETCGLCDDQDDHSDECKDKWSMKKCKKMKQKGGCDNPKKEKYCMETCGKCEDETH